MIDSYQQFFVCYIFHPKKLHSPPGRSSVLHLTVSNATQEISNNGGQKVMFQDAVTKNFLPAPINKNYFMKNSNSNIIWTIFSISKKGKVQPPNPKLPSGGWQWGSAGRRVRQPRHRPPQLRPHQRPSQAPSRAPTLQPCVTALSFQTSPLCSMTQFGRPAKTKKKTNEFCASKILLLSSLGQFLPTHFFHCMILVVYDVFSNPLLMLICRMCD